MTRIDLNTSLLNPAARWTRSRLQSTTPLYWDLIRLDQEQVGSVTIVSEQIYTQVEKYGGAPQAASERGHEEVVQILLEKGANVDAEGGYNGSALQAASLGGYEKVVQIPLEKGANIYAQTGYFSNPLQARCCSKTLVCLMRRRR